MSTGEKINRLRKAKGISQELLAENARVSLRTIQRIESGASVPRLHTLKVIADVLEVPVDHFTSDESKSIEQTVDIHDLQPLRVINLSALLVFILPLSNIVLPFLLWRKKQTYITGRYNWQKNHQFSYPMDIEHTSDLASDTLNPA